MANYEFFHILIGPRDTAHLSLTPALSHPMGEGARRAGEGTVSCILAIAQSVSCDEGTSA